MDVTHKNTGGQSLDEQIETAYSKLPIEGRAELVTKALSIAADYGIELIPNMKGA